MADPAVLEALAQLVDVMARLRAPGGCPWDREQTPASLRPYLIEEAYEVLDAIDAGHPDHLQDELGDLLLQIVFHAEIAREAGGFDLGGVARAITAKLVRRHPHVFADATVRDADEVARNWQRIKAEERRSEAPTAFPADDVPRHLPALARAQGVGRRLAREGLDWNSVTGPLAKLLEEHEELEAAIAAKDPAAIAHELGDVLLTVTSIARHLDVDAELALRDATTRFQVRSGHVLAAAERAGAPLASLDEAAITQLWDAAKAATASPPKDRV